MDATDCAIDGTVICASRADGFVDRIGSPGAARGGIGCTGAAAGAACALAGTAFGWTVSFLATGLAFAAGAAFLAGAFLAGAVRTGDFAALAGAFLAGALAAGFATTFFGTAFFATAFLAAGFATLVFAGTTAFAFAFAAGLAVLVPAFG